MAVRRATLKPPSRVIRRGSRILRPATATGGGGGGGGTVTFDAVGPSASGIVGTASPTTWTHVNHGNCIVVGCTYTNASPSSITAVTYGGVALARIAQSANGDDLWGLISNTLPTGSNTVSVTGGSPSSTNHITGGSLSFGNAASFGTPVTNSPGASTSSVSAAVPSTTAGGMIAASASFGTTGSTFSATNGGTLRWSAQGDNNTASDNSPGGTWISPGGSQTVGFSSTSSDIWGLIAVEILPAAAAVPAPPSRPLIIPQAVAMASTW